MVKPPPFVGVFPSKFPGWIPPEEVIMDGGCPMFKMPSGTMISIRYSPVGVSGIDRDGQLWVLVEDYGTDGHRQLDRLCWIRFPVEVRV